MGWLAELYRAQGRYAEAEPLFIRALAIEERALGPNHPQISSSLNNLALLYDTQSRYAEAEPLFRRALAIQEKALGPNHLQVGSSLNNLALLYDSQGDSSAVSDHRLRQRLA
jgi:tetratricopeptide (TPR) repeat protein